MKKKQNEKKHILILDYAKEIIDGDTGKLTVVTAIFSVISLLALKAFKGSAYIYEMGFCSKWNIPITYIEIGYSNILKEFLFALAIITIFILIAILYCYGFDKSNLFNKILLVFLIPVLVFVALVIFLLQEFELKEVLMGIRESYSSVVVNVIIISLIIYGILAMIGCFAKILKEMNKMETDISIKDEGKDDKTNETDSDNKKRNIAIWKIIGILLTLMVETVGFEYQIYRNGMNKFDKMKTVELITQEGQDYIIADKSEGQWIIKPCRVDIINGKVIVDKEDFKIEKDMDMMIKVFELKGTAKENVIIK